MTIRPLSAALAVTAAGFIISFATPAEAQDPLRVFASNGVRAVVEELLPKCESAIGRKISVEYNSTTALKQNLAAGATFDVAIITAEGMDDWIKSGRIAVGSRAELARSGVGVGMRAGASKPDVRTSAALKQTLLKAKSITYAEDGASRAYVDKMLDRFGITAEIGRKTVMEQGSTRATTDVADGKVELVITLISEILPAKGVQLVGPLPAEVQGYVSFSAGIGTDSKNSKDAAALIKFLKSPAVRPTLKAKGMEAVTVK